jgi:hypothetical protein
MPILKSCFLSDPRQRLTMVGRLFLIGNYLEAVSSQYGNLKALISGHFTDMSLSHMDFGQVMGTILFLTASYILATRGNNPKWFTRSCMLSMVALMATDASAMMQIPQKGWCALGSVLVFVVSNLLGIFGQNLYSRYHTYPLGFLRWTLGKPRVMMGLIGALSMLMALPDAVNPLTAVIYILWLAAELLLCFTTPDSEMDSSKVTEGAYLLQE